MDEYDRYAVITVDRHTGEPNLACVYFDRLAPDQAADEANTLALELNDTHVRALVIGLIPASKEDPVNPTLPPVEVETDSGTPNPAPPSWEHDPRGPIADEPGTFSTRSDAKAAEVMAAIGNSIDDATVVTMAWTAQPGCYVRWAPNPPGSGQRRVYRVQLVDFIPSTATPEVWPPPSALLVRPESWDYPIFAVPQLAGGEEWTLDRWLDAGYPSSAWAAIRPLLAALGWAEGPAEVRPGDVTKSRVRSYGRA